MSKSSLYFFQSGDLQRRQNTLKFVNKKQKKFIPVTAVRDIHLFGEVNVNSSALNFLGQHGIALHTYNYYNCYTGSYLPRKRSGTGQLTKLKQAETYLDYSKRLELAKLIVEGSLKNIEKVLAYYNRRAIDVGKNIEVMQKQQAKIKNAKSIETLMAIEGRARENYYQAWDPIIQNGEFLFEKRTRQPPKNKLNTLISFGNMLLYGSCLTEVYATSLDPGIGFLHSTNERSFSLNLDVSEIFKPIIVDRVIFSVLRNKRIKASQFKKHKQGWRLLDDSREVFLETFNNRLKETLKPTGSKTSVSFRTLIRRECYKIERHVLGEEEYKPYVLKW